MASAQKRGQQTEVATALCSLRRNKLLPIIFYGPIFPADVEYNTDSQ